MWLNCKVIKKWQSPNLYINPPPPYQVYSPFLPNISYSPPKWLNFRKVLPPPLIGKGGGGGGGFQLWFVSIIRKIKVNNFIVVVTFKICLYLRLHMSIICTRFHFRRIFIIFQVTPIILVILLSFLSRTLHKTWKSHYRQLQVLTMTFNEKAHVNICSISSSKKPWNLLSFVSRTVLNECLKNSVRNCFSFAFDFELLVKL